MPRTLSVTVLKDDAVFLQGDFTVGDDDYATVSALLPEAKLERGNAASMLSGYMHARDVGQVTEDLGKLAMIAAVYMLDQGETEIAIPLESKADHG